MEVHCSSPVIKYWFPVSFYRSLRPYLIMSLSHPLSSCDFMRCVCAVNISLKCARPFCFFLPWPQSTLPPEFLPLQLLVCCKSDQGAELVLTSTSLFCVGFVFFPWSGVLHSAAAGKNCAGTTEITMWTGLGGEAEVLLPDCSSAENTNELLSRTAFCCYEAWLSETPSKWFPPHPHPQ